MYADFFNGHGPFNATHRTATAPGNHIPAFSGRSFCRSTGVSVKSCRGA